MRKFVPLVAVAATLLASVPAAAASNSRPFGETGLRSAALMQTEVGGQDDSDGRRGGGLFGGGSGGYVVGGLAIVFIGLGIWAAVDSDDDPVSA